MKLATYFYFTLVIKIINISNFNSNYSFKNKKKSSKLINNIENNLNSFNDIKKSKNFYVNNLNKKVNKDNSKFLNQKNKIQNSKKFIISNTKIEKIKKQSNQNKKNDKKIRKNTELECYISCEKCTKKGDEKKHLCNKCKSNYYPLIKKNENNLNFNCYKNTTLIEHYYFDEIEQKFNECSQECLTCFDKSNLYDTNCLICDYNKHYIPSIYDFSNCIKECEKGHRIYIYENNNFKNYLCTENDICPSDYPIYNESLNQCFNKCNYDKFNYKNNCIDFCPNDTLIDDLHKICYNIPKNINNLIKDIGDIILSIPKNVELSFNYGSIKVIVYNNSYSENLLINFTECLNVFKSVYNLNDDNFLFSKIEYINNTFIVNKIEYLVFNEYGKLLNLSVCSELNVKVNYIIINESNINIDLAKKFSEEYNIDIFNENDQFFNDICFNFTSENLTDVTLKDRKENYYQNISFCKKECTYLNIDLEKKIVECVCPINSIFNIDEEENKNEIENNDDNEYYFTSNNYEVILCYNKVFNKKILKINLGNYIMLFIVLIYFILIFEYLFRGKKNIALYIVINKYENSNPPKKKKNNNSIIFDNENFLTHTKCKSTILSEEINIDENKENKESNEIINIPIFHNNINKNIKKEENDLDKIERHKKNINILTSLHNNYIIKPDISLIKTNKLLTLLNNNTNDNNIQNNTNLILKDNLNNNSINHSINSFSKRTTTTFILGPKDTNNRLKKKNNKKNSKIKTCLEYDEMSFQSALLYDKRNIFYAYWEELKDKQIFLCLFFNKDLMLKQLKITSFLIGTATDFFFNAFFYTDKYISKNYNDGALEYVTTLPKTILSSILTQLFCCFLDYLISSKMILLFLKKKQKKNNIYYRQCNNLINMCICKIRVFIIVTSFSLIFFWYYITAFCAVYQNSQINWIKDTLNSFWISLLTPLALCFISLLLRNISIKKKNKVLFLISKTLMVMV